MVFLGALDLSVFWYDLSKGFRLKRPPREIDSNQLMTQAVSRRVESIQLMT